MGHSWYYSLPVWNVDVVHRLNNLPCHFCLEQMEGAIAQVGSCSHLLAYCRFLLAYHFDSDARSGILGMEPFHLIWTCAIAGTVMSFAKLKDHSNLETICFVGMGLSVLVAFKPLIDSVSPATVIWIIAEGVCYITGAVFYSINKKRYMSFGIPISLF